MSRCRVLRRAQDDGSTGSPRAGVAAFDKLRMSGPKNQKRLIHRHRMRMFPRSGKPHIRCPLDRQLQIHARRRQINQLAGGIERKIECVLLPKLLQLLRIRTMHPARGGDGDRFEDRVHTVFVFQAIGDDVELQRADCAEAPPSSRKTRPMRR